MQELTRPASLSQLSRDINDLRNAHLNLNQCQVEYKRKVGLSGHISNDLPFHPTALEVELKDLKEHFKNLERNYINHQSKEKFLQYMLQEPPLEITSTTLRNIERNNHALKTTLKQYNLQISELKLQIRNTAELIEKTMETSLERADDTQRVLDEKQSMESELHRISQLLSQKSEYTIEQAKSKIEELTEAMAQYNRIIEERKESIEDQQWKVEELLEEVNQLEAKSELLTNKAMEAVKLNIERDVKVEEEYQVFKETTDMCNRMFGVESIEFESSSLVHIVYANPFLSTLHIDIDYNNKISNASFTGQIVEIDDLVEMAKQYKLDDGMRIIILETLARLKKL